jgi:hypothetical protein
VRIMAPWAGVVSVAILSRVLLAGLEGFGSQCVRIYCG